MSVYLLGEAGRLPGGCMDCAAHQTLTEVSPNVYVLHVHHDDTCPTYRAMREGQR